MRTSLFGRALALLVIWLLTGIAALALPDPVEQEDYKVATEAINDDRPLQARKIAEKRLKADPQDLVGLYLMTLLLTTEGVAPRAYLYSGKALDSLSEVVQQKQTATPGHLELYRKVSGLRLYATMSMERYQEALDLIATHDQFMEPRLESMAGWPLMKLGRLEEARQRMQAVAEKGDPEEQMTALNTLGGLFWLEGDVKASRDCYIRAMTLAQESGMPIDTTILANTAEAELGLGDFVAAERYYLEASENFTEWTSSNPYEMLSIIYLDQARFSQALDATRKMYAWSSMSSPLVQSQSWASKRKQLAAFLLACGYAEESLPILEELLYRPERNSNTSDQPYRVECEILLLYQEALGVAMAQSAERASWSSLSDRISAWPESFYRWRELGAAQERAGALVMEHDALAQSFLPYQADWVGSPWLVPDLIEAVGNGVAAVQLEQQESASDDSAKPYLNAYLGEARLRQGRYEEAIPLLRTADQELPEAQILLRSRVRLGLAWAQEQSQEETAATANYLEVLKVDPNMFRRLELGLPVKYASDQSATADRVVAMLKDSPRFRTGENGFTIEVSASEKGAKARLLDAQGSAVFWADVSESEDSSDLAAQLCQKFHQAVFAPRVQLERADIAKIQGTGPDALGF